MVIHPLTISRAQLDTAPMDASHATVLLVRHGEVCPEVVGDGKGETGAERETHTTHKEEKNTSDGRPLAPPSFSTKLHLLGLGAAFPCPSAVPAAQTRCFHLLHPAHGLGPSSVHPSICCCRVPGKTQTDWNKCHRMQGQTDIPLNDVGRDQVRRLRQGENAADAATAAQACPPAPARPSHASTRASQARAAAGALKDRHIDGVYSSDLARAHETAEVIVAARDTPVCGPQQAPAWNAAPTQSRRYSPLPPASSPFKRCQHCANATLASSRARCRRRRRPSFPVCRRLVGSSAGRTSRGLTWPGGGRRAPSSSPCAEEWDAWDRNVDANFAPSGGESKVQLADRVQAR